MAASSRRVTDEGCLLTVGRLVTNKLLLAVIIVMELAILGAVVYLKFFR